jgi:hypothetical protein
MLVLRANVDEVDVEPVDLGDELRQGPEPRLALAPVVLGFPVAASAWIVASCTPWDSSSTVSFSGQFVAPMRSRRSSRASSETSNSNERMSVVWTVVLITTSVVR